VVASALVAEIKAERARLKPGCPILGVQVQLLPSAQVVSNVRDGIWETCRIQTPVPVEGVQVRLLPDLRDTGRW
jgi:hypothetical protein